jgi:hypothetical protein
MARYTVPRLKSGNEQDNGLVVAAVVSLLCGQETAEPLNNNE